MPLKPRQGLNRATEKQTCVDAPCGVWVRVLFCAHMSVPVSLQHPFQREYEWVRFSPRRVSSDETWLGQNRVLFLVSSSDCI